MKHCRDDEDAADVAAITDVLPVDVQRLILMVRPETAMPCVCRQWRHIITQAKIDWYALPGRPFFVKVDASPPEPHGLICDVSEGRLVPMVTGYFTSWSTQGNKALANALTVLMHKFARHPLGLVFVPPIVNVYLTTASFEALCYRNFHRRDLRVVFREEGHEYRLLCFDSTHGFYQMSNTEQSPPHRRLLSVTTFVHTLFPDLDSVVLATETLARRAGWRDQSTNEYAGMTAEEVCARWQAIKDEAAERGTAMHANLENYYNEWAHSRHTKEFALFQEFEQALVHGKLRAFRTEWILYNERWRLVGSVDILYEYVDEVRRAPDAQGKKHLVLMDWKRSRQIKRHGFGRWGCVPATADLPDCNLEHYRLQLQLYKALLEAEYDVVIDAMYIVVLHPDQEHYETIEVTWDETRMARLLEARQLACAQ